MVIVLGSQRQILWRRSLNGTGVPFLIDHICVNAPFMSELINWLLAAQAKSARNMLAFNSVKFNLIMGWAVDRVGRP